MIASHEVDLSARERPVINHENAFFWEGVRRHELLYRTCAKCGRIHHPAGPMCPKCHGLEWNTHPCKGLGTIYSFTIGYYPQFPGLSYPNPIVLVELDEGWRLVANLRGVDPDEIRIGQRVRAAFVDVDDTFSVPVFEPIGEGRT